ncbi:MAG: HNH endonuclease [Mesorhizobium sp.]|uniref:HNH endonuclease n=1 Tax=Mesorhizobium sp. TaxID=1871066 RepID=UPI00120B4304|nr:HNH endonuclease [Mesorhizobium sp.]TIL91441.1 MAG: HNH endonuclease [Mesorhizobium sp.]
MKRNHHPSQQRIKEVLSYNPADGRFTWLVDRIRVRQGNVAGKTTKEGYVEIGIDGKRYQAHRLAFVYMTGYVPDAFIDHINLNKSDNRWKNLRIATNSQNQMNTTMKSNNTSGYKGVSWHKTDKRWRADIRVNGSKVFLGYFDTPESGHDAYRKAANAHHGEYARAA